MLRLAPINRIPVAGHGEPSILCNRSCSQTPSNFVTHALHMFPAPPAAPGTPFVNFSSPRMEFTITWAESPLNVNETIDAYFVNISGPNNLCGTGNTLPNVTERSYTCTIETTPREGETYTITVAAANCGGSLRGPESAPVRLQGIGST